jgi:hypothetical protein
MVMILAVVGCGSGSHSLDGTWDGSGALQGDTLTLTQSGDDVAGSVEGVLTGSVTGTNVSGNVTIRWGQIACPSCNSIPLAFTGHFVNAVTIVGSMGAGPLSAVTLSRAGN